jgi:hypothetical protein
MTCYDDETRMKPPWRTWLFWSTVLSLVISLSALLMALGLALRWF